MSKEIFAFGPSLCWCPRLSCLPSITSPSSLSFVSWMEVLVSGHMACLSTFETHPFSHCFFTLLGGKNIYIHCIWVFRWLSPGRTEWSSSSSVLSSVVACLAKYGHHSSVIIVKLYGFCLPCIDRRWYGFSIKNLLEKRLV